MLDLNVDGNCIETARVRSYYLMVKNGENCTKPFRAYCFSFQLGTELHGCTD